MLKRFVLLSLFLVVSFPALAETLVLKRTANLRVGPSKDTASIAHLAAGARVTQLEATPQNSYLNVRASNGKKGWIYSEYLQQAESATTSHGHSSTFLARRSKAQKKSQSGPCADDLASCPVSGCAEEGTPHALFNETKRTRPQPGTATKLSFKDFAALQAAVDDLGLETGHNVEWTEKMRKKLRGLDIKGNMVGEGDFVELVGYIAPEREIKASGGESVNCRLTDADSNDIHLPIVRKADESEYHAIVVEPIPQDRPAAWSVETFRSLQEEGKLLRIRGQLFFDTEHKVRDDPEHEEGVSNQPKRFSLWEIHPITEIYKCKREGEDCDPKEDSQWQRIE